MTSPFLGYLKTHKLIVGTAVIIIGGIALYAGSSSEPIVDTVTVARGTIREEVSVTGKTKAAQDISLAFEVGGRVSRIAVVVGDRVRPGQVLAELERNELAAQLRQAQANLQVQEARLAEIKRGSRPEEIQIKQTELKKAQQDLVNLYASTANVLGDAYIKADDAVRKQTDPVFNNDDGTNPTLTFSVSDAQKKTDAETYRVIARTELTAWNKELSRITASSPENELEQNLALARGHLLQIRDFLAKTSDAANVALSIDDTTLATYKTSLTTGRTNVNTAVISVTNHEQSIFSQKIVVSRIADELALKLAGSAPEQIDAQIAQVAQTEAAVQLIYAQLAKRTIVSPINGVITKRTIEPGEIAIPNTAFLTVISENNFEVEANVPEADVAKLQVGNPATITFDAYGDDVVFSGKVAEIDPAETIIEGVPTFKTTFALDGSDARLKSGLTANLVIETAVKENVLVIPQRSIIYQDGKKMVKIHSSKGPSTDRIVTTGARGSDGMIEVLEGLREGEVIVGAPGA